MTDKELRKLNRSELLEILFYIKKEYDELLADYEELSDKLKRLEEQSASASDLFSQNDIDRVLGMLNSSLDAGAASTKEITDTFETLIERWRQSEREERIRSEEKTANMLGELLNQHYCVQADVTAPVLHKEDYKRLAEVFDYILDCNSRKRMHEGTLHEKDAEMMSEIMKSALLRHDKTNKSERNLTDMDMLCIEKMVRKAVADAIAKN